MHEESSHSGDQVFGYAIRELLTEDQLDAVPAELEEPIADHRSGRPRVSMQSMPFFGVKALDDLGVRLRHSEQFGRYGVVGERPLLERSSNIVHRVAEPDIENIRHAEIGNAWEWIENDQPSGVERNDDV